MYLSNCQDMIGIWMASKLSQTDPQVRGPRLGELHFLGGRAPMRSVNQIVDYTGFFRDESGGFKYTDVQNFEAEAWFESGADNAGTLTSTYLGYTGAPTQPRLQIARSYVAVPSQPFLVVQYRLRNPTAGPITFNILDQVHLANVNSTRNVHAWYDSDRNALIADMSASGQFFAVLGVFQQMEGHQVGDETVSDLGSPAVAGWYSFDHDGTLKNNGELWAANISLAFQQRLTVAPGEAQSLYLYLTIRGDLPTAQAAADKARARPGDYWFSQTAASYTAWLANGGRGRRVHFDDTGINDAFDRALIAIRNIQNPAVGTFSAATNPFAYKYKNWAHDAAITAIALDASGHYAEAEQYWRWMALVQGNDGTWKTIYSMWDGSYLSFVEPEYDSVGAFIYGIYRHHLYMGDVAFLNDLWPNVQRAADWILQSLSPVNGLGAADFSIWEEPERGLQHHSFTQAWYVAGLYAAQCLAQLRGDTALADWYAGGPQSIMTALQRPSNWYPPGMWNPQGYYNRGVNQNNTPQEMVDSSTDVLIALGLIDHESGRAGSHIDTVTRDLAHDTFGVARYQGDIYYYQSPWDPAGNEALGPDPSWPQMSVWVAVYEILSGQRDRALARLQWFVSTDGRGYMPHGEAISNVSLQPVLSSMSEPLTASAFILAALVYEGQRDLRIIPPVYNAGTFKSIAVSPGPAGDWGQWRNVAYFVANPVVGSRSPMTTIKRIYLTNDAADIYIRIDNLAGFLPAHGDQPKFALRVYSADFAQGGATSTNFGRDNKPLDRPVSFLAELTSDSDGYIRLRVEGGLWVYDSPIVGVIAPQWDTATGRIEAVIPIAALASGSPAPGSAWANVVVALAFYDTTSNYWDDDGKILIHYRLSTGAQAWIYGNIEQ